MAKIPFCYNFTAMGGSCSLHLYASRSCEADIVAEAAENEVLRLEKKYSRYNNEGVLAAINAAGNAGKRIEVDEETAGLLNYAVGCYVNSEGLFDITSGVLRKGWNFSQGTSLPKTETIEKLLSLVGMEKISWEPPFLEFSCKGMELDLGGIVKEYAADRIAESCLEQEISHGLAELGGDIRIIGPHPDGSPWKIDIRNPLKPEEIIKEISLVEGALTGSGDYERCIVVDGVRYGHLLNPKTGWSVQGLRAVHVVSDRCLVAGSISTIAMLKGFEGIKWLESLPLLSIWIDENGACGGNL
ncbi:MAG: FAD:protein FMN transferase [Nitrospinae bacterium]|nr:FAD:protein FMN transferase [Nitrospinota bacterium]